ncbi:cell wall-binding repeat-containing protein [Clostridium sp.]|uniref:cell wall-binding repeat-containing protein n=1 Tax=Clostridium sp. TaxID=1506 RepID=UPI00291027B0|nr:cell wall-binding repeat-containing protein [Clostridium sp.]MDU5108520.1 cell wall-binding repeat-containing protein [Clostridium sp.]
MQFNTVILVNGTSIVDGLSASGLIGRLNAPILLTEVDNIPKVTLDNVTLADKVYLIGGTGVISTSIENKLKSIGNNVVCLGGIDRFSTSYLVADEIQKIKGIDSLYYVNGLIGQADAMSIAPVAAITGNPIILTDGNNTSYRKNIKSYSIGGLE